MVRARITMAVDPSHCDEAVQGLRSIVEPTRAQTGCLDCILTRDADDECRLSLIEEWSTEEDLHRRLRSREYLNLLMLLELSTGAPCVQFDFIDHRRGIELVHEMRGSEDHIKKP